MSMLLKITRKLRAAWPFSHRYKMYSRNINVPQDHCSFEISTYNLFEGRKDKNVHSEDWGTYSPKSNLLLFARFCEMTISQSSHKGFMIVNRLPNSPGLWRELSSLWFQTTVSSCISDPLHLGFIEFWELPQTGMFWSLNSCFRNLTQWGSSLGVQSLPWWSSLFPGGPEAPPLKAGGAGSIPGQKTKILHATKT